MLDARKLEASAPACCTKGLLLRRCTRPKGRKENLHLSLLGYFTSDDMSNHEGRWNVSYQAVLIWVSA